MSSVQTKVHAEFHVSLLKWYVAATDGRTLTRPPPVVADTDTYEVVCMLCKPTWRKQNQYLVKWKVYSVDESTWELLPALQGA